MCCYNNVQFSPHGRLVGGHSSGGRRRQEEADRERKNEREGEREEGVMPMHLDISALHFPGNRWKQCIKAPRGNPGHPGIAEPRPGSGGAGGHLFPALNRLPHPPSPRRAWLFGACMCGRVHTDVFLSVCVQYGCLSVGRLFSRLPTRDFPVAGCFH